MLLYSSQTKSPFFSLTNNVHLEEQTLFVWGDEDEVVVPLGQSLSKHGHQRHEISCVLPDWLLYHLCNTNRTDFVKRQEIKSK